MLAPFLTLSHHTTALLACRSKAEWHYRWGPTFGQPQQPPGQPLPWRPQIKPYLGATRYELDESGLIVSHNEEWSISALEAFGSTLWPALGARAVFQLSGASTWATFCTL